MTYPKKMEKKMTVPIRLHLVDTGRDLGTGMNEKMSIMDMHLIQNPSYLFYLIMLCFSASVMVILGSLKLAISL